MTPVKTNSSIIRATSMADSISEIDVKPVWRQLVIPLLLRDVIVPCVALGAVDISLLSAQAAVVIRFIVFALPVYFKLNRQIRIWQQYGIRFGFPTSRSVRKVIDLASSRSMSSSAIGTTTRFLGCASVLLIIATFTGTWTLGYLAYLVIIYWIHRMLRISRPPAILLLSASSKRADALALYLNTRVCRPFRCYHLLRTSSDWSRYFDRAMNYRTKEEFSWKVTVETLMYASPFVVIDIEESTEALEFEINLAREPTYFSKAYFISDSETALDLTEPRRFSTWECFSEIAEKCGNYLEPARKHEIQRIVEHFTQ